MTNEIRIFKNNSLEKVLKESINFETGSYNIVLFQDIAIRNELLEIMVECRSDINPYIISGFNLRPYLNLIDNIYDILNIDLSLNFNNSIKFNRYCDILDFKKFDVQFHFLNNLEKLKSMLIVSLLTKNKVIVFDSIYSKELTRDVDMILERIRMFHLFSNKVFIELKKQVAS